MPAARHQHLAVDTSVISVSQILVACRREDGAAERQREKRRWRQRGAEKERRRDGEREKRERWGVNFTRTNTTLESHFFGFLTFKVYLNQLRHFQFSSSEMASECHSW